MTVRQLDTQEQARFEQGVALFNRRRFYACHDLIEEIWLQESSDFQTFLQGIIQAAVTFHHYQQGSRGAARTMCSLAIEKLESHLDSCCNVDVPHLLGQLRQWREALEDALASGSGEVSLEYPRIRLLSSSG